MNSKKQAAVLWSDHNHVLWFPIGTKKYTLKDDDRLYIDEGILSTVSNQTLLYRVTDIQMSRTLGQKLFGTGTIVLISKIDQDHEIVLKNIARPKQVLEMLSNKIEETRRREGLVGKEFFEQGCGTHHSLEDAFQGDIPGMDR